MWMPLFLFQLLVAAACAWFTFLSAMPCFRWARVYQYMLTSEEASKSLTTLLTLEFWGPLFLAMLWLRSVANVFLFEQLRPCHVRAPFYDCTEHGEEDSFIFTESHMAMVRWGSCVAFVVLRAVLLRPYLTNHLERATTYMHVVKNPKANAKELNNLVMTPYTYMFTSLIQYVCPLLWFLATALAYKQQAQLSIGVCHGIRALNGSESPFCASGGSVADQTGAGRAMVMSPVWGFFLFWSCLSNFVSYMIAIMYWAGKAHGSA